MGAPDRLYDEDFIAWTEQQAEALREVGQGQTEATRALVAGAPHYTQEQVLGSWFPDKREWA